MKPPTATEMRGLVALARTHTLRVPWDTMKNLRVSEGKLFKMMGDRWITPVDGNKAFELTRVGARAIMTANELTTVTAFASVTPTGIAGWKHIRSVLRGMGFQLAQLSTLEKKGLLARRGDDLMYDTSVFQLTPASWLAVLGADGAEQLTRAAWDEMAGVVEGLPLDLSDSPLVELAPPAPPNEHDLYTDRDAWISTLRHELASLGLNDRSRAQQVKLRFRLQNGEWLAGVIGRLLDPRVPHSDDAKIRLCRTAVKVHSECAEAIEHLYEQWVQKYQPKSR